MADDEPKVIKHDAKDDKKVGPKVDTKNGKMKWYVVGGLALVAVLVFFFVSRSNSNAAGSASTGSGSTLDPATEAALQSALQDQASGIGTIGPQGPAGPAGPAGPTGPAGATGKTGATGATGKTPSPPKPVTATKSYTVRAGDTLASIAARYGISVATLAHANVYVKGELPGNAKVGQTLGTGAGLKTGQVLKIPNKQ